MAYKWIRIEIDFDEGTNEVFSVLDDNVDERHYQEDPEVFDVICDCYSREDADLIVGLLNEHFEGEDPKCTTLIH